MEQKEFVKYIGKDILVFVRYGFKKNIEETQSYQGKLIKIGLHGVIVERNLAEVNEPIVHDFFPWHNIVAIRCRLKD